MTIDATTVSEEDVRAVHSDYPTAIEQVNILYRDHTARVRAHFEAAVREQVAQEIIEHGPGMFDVKVLARIARGEQP